MKEIISCSRRTDIPAFYYDWLQEVLASQSVTLQHPLYPEKTYTVDLAPDKVHSLVLWSKDFSQVAQDPGYLSLYHLYFQYTITLYGSELEPHVPDYTQTLKTLEILRKTYSDQQFNFRYDPILLSDQVSTASYQARIQNFEWLCQQLQALGYQQARLTTSFISCYLQTLNRLKAQGIQLKKLYDSEILSLFQELALIAQAYGFTLYSCANYLLESIPLIQKGHCIDGQLLQALFGKCTQAKDKGQRLACGCVKSRDIGGYLPCRHGCYYCYSKGVE